MSNNNTNNHNNEHSGLLQGSFGSAYGQVQAPVSNGHQQQQHEQFSMAQPNPFIMVSAPGQYPGNNIHNHQGGGGGYQQGDVTMDGNLMQQLGPPQHSWQPQQYPHPYQQQGITQSYPLLMVQGDLETQSASGPPAHMTYSPSAPTQAPQQSLTPTAQASSATPGVAQSARASRIATPKSPAPTKGGKGTAKTKRGGRKRSASQMDGNLTDDSLSEEYSMEGMKTKSGRQVHRPAQFNPVVKAPTRRRGPYRKSDELKVCKVCARGHSPQSNAIVFCDGCNQTYHQMCHDPPIDDIVISIPEAEWYCKACQVRKEEKQTRTGLSGEGLSDYDKRTYLASLPNTSLVDLLFFAESLHPDLPIYDPNIKHIVEGMREKHIGRITGAGEDAEAPVDQALEAVHVSTGGKTLPRGQQAPVTSAVRSSEVTQSAEQTKQPNLTATELMQLLRVTNGGGDEEAESTPRLDRHGRMWIDWEIFILYAIHCLNTPVELGAPPKDIWRWIKTHYPDLESRDIRSEAQNSLQRLLRQNRVTRSDHQYKMDWQHQSNKPLKASFDSQGEGSLKEVQAVQQDIRVNITAGRATLSTLPKDKWTKKSGDGPQSKQGIFDTRRADGLFPQIPEGAGIKLPPETEDDEGLVDSREQGKGYSHKWVQGNLGNGVIGVVGVVGGAGPEPATNGTGANGVGIGGIDSGIMDDDLDADGVADEDDVM